MRTLLIAAIVVGAVATTRASEPWRCRSLAQTLVLTPECGEEAEP